MILGHIYTSALSAAWGLSAELATLAEQLLEAVEVRHIIEGSFDNRSWDSSNVSSCIRALLLSSSTCVCVSCVLK